MNHHALIAALVVCASSNVALAQTVVLPAGYANQVGNVANIFPFGTTNASYAGLRTQFVYDSSEFTSQAIAAPIVITGIRIRADDTANSWTGGTWASATVSMSTAAVNYLAATTTWASNHGPDLTVMHNGPVVVQPGTGNGAGVPGPFHISIPFTNSFLYDPSTGDDFVLDLDSPSPSTNWGGGTFTGLDHTSAAGNPSPLGRRVYSSSAYPNANNVDQYLMVCELTYAPAAGYSSVVSYGSGCYQVSDTSFYELFAAGTHDLSNSSMSMFHSGTGYTVIGGAAVMFPTTGATALILGDDAEVSMPLTGGSIPYGTYGAATSLNVCSNGFVSVGSNGTGRDPVAAPFLAAGRTGWWCWHNYSPQLAGSGQVMWQETASHVYVTWNNVWSFGTTGPGSTFQLQFEKTTGHVHYVFGTIDNTGNGHLVGFSEGGTSVNPGSVDLSVALTSTFVGHYAVSPITLASSARPVLGTSFSLNTTFIPAGSAIGGTILSLTEVNPGIDLASFGMPGCRQYLTNDAVVLFFGSPAAAVPLVLPNNPAFAGIRWKAQSAALSAGANALGAVASNGLRLTIDIL